MVPKKLLVVKNRALGDAVISLSTLNYLRQILPNTEIIYAVPRWTFPLFQNVETSADQIIPFDLKTPLDWWKAFRMLNRLEVDCVFEMFQSGRTQKFFKLYSRLKGIPYLPHNHHKEHANDGLVLDQGILKPVIQRDLDGAWSFFGKPRGKSVPDYKKYQPDWTLKRPVQPLPQIIFGMVASRPEKMYPTEEFAALARLIHKEYPHMEILAPLSHSAQDSKIESAIYSTGAPISIVRKSLSELPALFAQSRIYIGNDTGLKHIAIASGIPTVTLFGPELPLEWHPYDTKNHPYLFITNDQTPTKPSEVWQQALQLFSGF
ncbi:MAG: hypothetical protein K2Q26_12960 [Bdellovibrionales bacterium]|nr:hypothetical protein [Bdellovibrionales bacterium]